MMGNGAIIIARLLRGDPLDAVDIAELTEPYRVLAQTLIATNGHGRVEALNKVLAGREDGEAIRKAIFSTNPDANEKASADSWQVFTLIDAFKPRPPLVHVVDALFPLPSLSLAYGAPNTLKSFYLADMAVCVAAGRPWLEPLPNTAGAPRQTTQIATMWLDFDNGPRRTHERFEAIARAYKVDPDETPLYYVSIQVRRNWRLRVSSACKLRTRKATARLSVRSLKLWVWNGL